LGLRGGERKSGTKKERGRKEGIEVLGERLGVWVSQERENNTRREDRSQLFPRAKRKFGRKCRKHLL